MEAGGREEDASVVGWHSDGETGRRVGIGGGHMRTHGDMLRRVRGLTSEKIGVVVAAVSFGEEGRW